MHNKITTTRATIKTNMMTNTKGESRISQISNIIFHHQE